MTGRRMSSCTQAGFPPDKLATALLTETTNEIIGRPLRRSARTVCGGAAVFPKESRSWSP
jgi:hypothetical protein